MRKIKDALFAFLIIVAVAAGFIFSNVNGMDHIEDANGPDDTSLAVITEAEITEEDVHSSIGGPNTKKSKFSILGFTTRSGTTYFSKQFSGIYGLETWNLFADSDLFFDLHEYEVTGGNFLMCIVHDNQIIATIEPTEDGMVQFLLEDVEEGIYDLYIVGESAAFQFTSHDFDDEV